MSTDEALAWFRELVERKLPTETTSYETTRLDELGMPFSASESETELDEEAAAQWVLEVGQALALGFPPGFELRQQWSRLFKDAQGPYVLSNEAMVTAARAIAKTAVRLLESGRLRSIWDGVRAETVGEVLDQATELLDDGAPPASAAVLAGGALETHLRHLCDRAGLLGSLSGHGSIDKYKGLLDTARKDGNEIITKGQGKQVVAWADDRNEAAHRPTTFAKTSPEVRLMIDGVRHFITRTE